MKLKYEDAILKLDQIAKDLESGDLTLEESVNSFKKAMEIYKHSNELLDKAEGEIKILLENVEGEIVEEDFFVEG